MKVSDWSIRKYHNVIALLNNAVLDGKLLDQVPLELLLGPLGTLLEDVVGGPQLVVKNRAGETFEDFLLSWSMNESFIDDTFIFLGIFYFSSTSDKLTMLIIQMAESSRLGLFLTIEWKLGHAVTTGEGAFVITNSTGVIEHLLVTSPGHGVMRDVMNPTLMHKLGQGIMILLDSIYKLSLSDKS